VEIVGAPATTAVAAGTPMHHTMADGDFGVFERMHADVTVARTTLAATDAGVEIDRVLRACVRHRRPVRIAVPCDLVHARIPVIGEPLREPTEAADPAVLARFQEAAARLIAGAERVAVVADHLAERHGARDALARVVAAGRLPVAVMGMGKGVVDESGPTFAGVYVGRLSTEPARATVEDADCLITVGVVVSDGNTAGFSHRFPAGATIEVQPEHARVGDGFHPGLPMREALAVLESLVANRPAQPVGSRPAPGPRPRVDASAPLTQDVLWERFADFLRAGDVVLAEQGTSFFGAAETRLPADARFVAQVLWSSIGYTLPATLGTCLAAPERRSVLVIGDGSIQLTGQELGTFTRVEATPVVIVVDNGGYSIERAIHPTEADYNDVAAWRYTDLPDVFGADGQALTARVTTPAELDAALAAADDHPDRLVLIQAVLAPRDYPDRLRRIVRGKRDRAGGGPTA